jgi:hypothetical protein
MSQSSMFDLVITSVWKVCRRCHGAGYCMECSGGGYYVVRHVRRCDLQPGQEYTEQR